MEIPDDGSSTESEYYDLSEDEDRHETTSTHEEDNGDHVHGEASGNGAEMSVIDISEDDEEHHDDEDDDAALTAFTGMQTQWNNILTPDLEAAVARVTALTSRRGRASPLAIPLDPPVETLPLSTDFVSPFAALATPAPHVPAVKEEKLLPTPPEAEPESLQPTEQAVETKPLAVATSRAAAPVRLVIDLSLDSDDDEEDEVLVRRVLAPPAQSPRVARAPSPPSPTRPVVSAIRSPRSPLVRPRPVSHAELSSRQTTAPPPVAQHPVRPVSQPVAPVKLTLSCTRCHRLVPDHPTATPALARYDCKCCGRKYTREELAVPGANRRCSFCKPLQATVESTSSSSAAASISHPQTPRSAAEQAAAYQASISPTAPMIALSPCPTPAKARSPARGHRQENSDRFTVSRAATMQPPVQPVSTCVTCHQPLKATKSLATVNRAVDPWFCTCCQRLLCIKDSPPDTAPGSTLKAIPRCMSCAIAACDLDSQMEKRRPHLEPLQELRRLSRLLQAMLDKLIKKLIDTQRDADALAIKRDPIKQEIDKRFSQWRSYMLSVRGGQRRTLQRDNVTLEVQRSLFKQQLALEEEEVDVRSRLVAYLAVTLHAHKVPLPREIRGIVGGKTHSRPHDTPQPRTASSSTPLTRGPPPSKLDLVKARSRAESDKSSRARHHSNGPHRRPFSSTESETSAGRQDTRHDSAKRHKDSRYLAYKPHR